MVREVEKTEFSEKDFQQFHQRLRKETKLLMDWFASSEFETDGVRCGLELEAWLIDEAFAPVPKNEEFLKRVNNPLVVAELSKYNFEINVEPHPLNRNLPSFLCQQLRTLWDTCSTHARDMGCQTLMTGILPTLQERILTLENISKQHHFHALHREILKSRSHHPLKIHIEGANDKLDVLYHDVIAEAATTSLQIHFQVPLSKVAAFYNVAHVLSAPMAALTANSPFLFGKELWHETRIPLLEQAINTPSFVDQNGHPVSRVTFGHDYVRNSLLELFLENLDGYPALLPVSFDADPRMLKHLRLHNDTIWRWNRPLIGFGADGKPHLRIEHRVPPAGPSIPDMVANILFFYGAMLHLQPEVPQAAISFEQARANFYAAARFGLDAEITWTNGKRLPVRDVLLQHLIPGALLSLAELGFDSNTLRFYLIDILANRVASGRNGAAWQKAFVAKYGPDFKAMAQVYLENQSQHLPVHRWNL